MEKRRRISKEDLPSCQVHKDDEVVRGETMNFTFFKGRSSIFQRNRGCNNDGVIRRERPRSYHYSITDENVVGFEEDVENLVQQLINQQSNRFSAIVGMGGSGKTTLSRKIYNHEETREHFGKYMAWICVSQVWNKEPILKDILSQTTGQDSNNWTVEKIVREICKLLEDKSYLVVLDDVWDQHVLREIMFPIANSCGSKFIITTRNVEVVRFPGIACPRHEVRRLTTKESWELFEKIAFGYQENPIPAYAKKDYEILGEEMLKKCDGLPLAIVSLAGLLSTLNTIHDWEDVRSNVSSKIIDDLVGPADYGRVEDILGLSFSYLDRTLKSCFMYLALFPEDTEIETGMLMRCWIAEGFFKSIRSNDRIQEVARKHVNELIKRHLVEDVRLSYHKFVSVIRIHDLLRNLAIKSAKERCFFDTIPCNSSSTATMQVLRLSVTTEESCGSVPYINFGKEIELQAEAVEDKGSRVRSFVWCMNMRTVNLRSWQISLQTIFTMYPLLRVLILSYIDYLPDEIGNLIHLRCLRVTSDSELPGSIRNLKNLLCLDFRTPSPCRWTKLPELKEMKKLTYLRLPEVDGGYDMALNLKYLSNVKTLWNICLYSPSMVTKLEDLSSTIEKLGIVEIENPEQLDTIYECPSIVGDRLYSLKLHCSMRLFCGDFGLQKIQHCRMLRKLMLKGEIAKGSPLVFPPRLLKLELIGSKIDDEVSFASVLEGLPHLKRLSLKDDAYFSRRLFFSANFMSHLEELILDHLSVVEEVHVEGASKLFTSYIINTSSSYRHLNIFLND